MNLQVSNRNNQQNSIYSITVLTDSLVKTRKSCPTIAVLAGSEYLSRRTFTISCLLGRSASVIISGCTQYNSVMITKACFLSSNSIFSISIMTYATRSLFLSASFASLIILSQSILQKQTMVLECFGPFCVFPQRQTLASEYTLKIFQLIFNQKKLN